MNCFVDGSIVRVIKGSWLYSIGIEKASNFYLGAWVFWVLFLVFLRCSSCILLPIKFVGTEYKGAWFYLVLSKRAFVLWEQIIKSGVILSFDCLFGKFVSICLERNCSAWFLNFECLTIFDALGYFCWVFVLLSLVCY